MKLNNKTKENYQVTNIKKSSFHKHIHFATMYLNNQDIEIVIKSYMNNNKTLKTSIANEKVVAEMTNEHGILKLLENITFPEGVLVPKSYFTFINRNKKLHVPIHFIQKMPGLDVTDWFDKQDSRLYTESTKMEIIYKACYAVKTLHDNNIVHRDIKPENIMIDFKDKAIILSFIDFGFAALDQNFTYKETVTFPGTFEYASPEILGHEPYYLKGADIWSLGVFIFSLFVGTQENTFKQKNLRIAKQVSLCDSALKAGFIPSLIHRILLLIFVDQETRITINNIVQMLEEDLQQTMDMDIDIDI